MKLVIKAVSSCEEMRLVRARARRETLLLSRRGITAYEARIHAESCLSHQKTSKARREETHIQIDGEAKAKSMKVFARRRTLRCEIMIVGVLCIIKEMNN